MKPMRSLTLGLMLGLSSVAGSSPALATVMVAPQVSGHVTALPGTSLIVVDGRQYLVAVNSAAFTQLQSVHVGDMVGLVLDGPATSSGSHVIAIRPVSGQ